MKRAACSIYVVIVLSILSNLFSSEVFISLVSAQSIPSFSRNNFQIKNRRISSELVDFNNDGILDIAIASNDTTTIMFGKNDGTFEKHTILETQTIVQFILADDFNNDGNIDLFVDTLLFFGDGQGVFEEPINHGLSSIYGNSGDFNNDDISDIIMGKRDDPGILVYIGKGDGTFQDPLSNNMLKGAFFNPDTTGDFNSDGNLDVVVQFECYTDEYGTTCKFTGTEGPVFYNNIAILFGNGDGTFQDSLLVIKEDQYYSVIPDIIIVSDVNKDSNLDIFFCGYWGLKMFLGDGKGSFSSSWNLFNWKSHYYPFLIDADSDGIRDIMSVGVDAPEGDFSNSYSFMKGNGDGTFGEEIFGTINGCKYPVKFLVADLNGDNREDFIIVNSDNIAAFLNQGIVSEIYDRETITQAPFIIFQNYPNPFNPVTTLSYSIAQPSNVTLRVYSITGQKVATLVAGTVPAVTHSVVFDGSNLASGMYFYRFKSANIEKTGKMLLMK